MISPANISLRIRIFLSMILLILLTSILIAIVTYRQYEVQTEEYNVQRFGRKEEATKQNIDIILDKTSYPLTSDNLSKIFQDRIYEVALIHKLTISIYDMNGKLLKSSIPFDFEKDKTITVSKETLKKLAVNSNHRVTEDIKEGGITHLSSYTYINDNRFKRIGVLELRIAQNNLDQKRELEEFMSSLSLVYMLMFVIAILLAYFLSSYITRSIQTISEKIKETRLNKRNEKITLESASSEINSLIESYNNMIDQLEESAVKLARSEREQAWKEMAKQVAHEIKNPLTPMRLSVQSFERKFNANDPAIKEKLGEYSNTLIQQIDVMSSIASAFSDFAKMPTQKREKIDVIKVIKHALDIFVEDYIIYRPKQGELIAYLDKSQLVRIVTNLVKNAIQAMEKTNPTPIVEITVDEINSNVVIGVLDNGIGIEKENIDLIFEPKFTTKTSGMGLGLPMVKKIVETYDGSIEFKSNKGKGTVFTVTLPKN